MALDKEAVEKIMIVIGPENHDIDLVTQDDESNWGVQFMDGATIRIEWVPNPAHLQLTAMIGEIYPQIRSHVCEILLAYNSLSSVTDGARMALTTPEGQAMLLLDLYQENLNIVELTNTMRTLVNVTKSWQPFLMGEGEFSKSPPIDSTDIRA